MCKSRDIFLWLFYHLLKTDLLEIQPASNNGTEGSLDHLLWHTFTRTRQAASNYSNASLSTSVTMATTCNCTLEPAQVGIKT